MNLYRYSGNSPLENIDFLGLQKRLGTGVGAVVDLIGDVVGGIELGIGNTPEDVYEECRNHCTNYAQNNVPFPYYGKSCCICDYSIRGATTGNVNGLNYFLYEARISPCITCEHIEKNKGVYPNKILYTRGGKRELEIDPITKMPKGKLGERFNV